MKVVVSFRNAHPFFKCGPLILWELSLCEFKRPKESIVQGSYLSNMISLSLCLLLDESTAAVYRPPSELTPEMQILK